MPNQSRGAEIGVYEGDFAARILRDARPNQLHLVDPWEHVAELENAQYGGQSSGQDEMDRRYEQVRRRFSKHIGRGQVKIHRSRSSEIADVFEDHYFDWVYIDGNHLFEYVLQDLKLYFPKVRPGGMLMGDDYGPGGWWEGGVKKAVDQFSEQKDLNLETHGSQFILTRPKQ